MAYKKKGYNPKSLENLKKMRDREPEERKALGKRVGNARARELEKQKVIIKHNFTYIPKGEWLINQQIEIHYNELLLLYEILEEAIKQVSHDIKKLEREAGSM